MSDSNYFDESSSALNAFLFVSTSTILKPSNEMMLDPTLKESKIANFDRWTIIDDSKINYGFLGDKLTLDSNYDNRKDSFYVTTAINYTNGPAHMGHAYEAATSDTIARYNRLKYGNHQVFFITGSDEHGQKIANTASDLNPPLKPIELCNKYVIGFQVLNQRMLISNNDYVRTTSDRHKNTAKELWRRCASTKNSNDESDIYISKYKGWYNVREETFVTDSDAKLSDFKDPTSGQPLKQVEEASYFFRMGKYHDKLVAHINSYPEFIQPQQYRNNILSRLNAEMLRDLSISRTTFDWGIPVPPEFDPKHVMYVWFDALSNYLTGVNALEVNGENHSSEFRNHWPAALHVIGKDIIWFHTVIWPCILMSAGLSLPKTVFAHGFVNDNEGIKMSKSIGNVIDPHDMLDKFPVDSFRWYLCKEAPYGGELSFSEESLMIMHNADLCDTLGNLVHRATNLCKKYCEGVIPHVSAPQTSSIDFKKLRSEFALKMDSFELDKGAAVVMQGFRDINVYLTEQAPWHMKGDERAKDRQIVVRAAVEGVYAMAHLFLPFAPRGASIVFEKLNTKPMSLFALNSNLRNLIPGTKIDVGHVLYNKLIFEVERSDAQAAVNKNTENYAEGRKNKRERKSAASAKNNAGKKHGRESDALFTNIDIRVGKITKVWNHPYADKLFCEEIDLGEEGGPRQIISGLRGFYKLDDLLQSKVLVVCNLKASKILGLSSFGIVLVAKGECGTKVELIKPPHNSKIGEKIYVGCRKKSEPASPAQMKKKKVWDLIVKELNTVEGGVATWEGKPLMTIHGACRAESLEGAPIS